MIITTPRSRSTESTRHAVAVVSALALEDPTSNSDFVPAVIKFTRSFLCPLFDKSGLGNDETAGDFKPGRELAEKICDEASQMQGELSNRRDECFFTQC
jgi:hypothetical protein